MADVTGASLTPIFDRLTQVPRHHPMEAQTFADWTTEAGDIVTMQRDGEDFAGPVHQTSMTWRGSAETRINSQENEEREDIEKVSKRKYGRSGSGMYNNNRLYYEMFDYNGELHSSLLMTESELRVHFDGLYDGLQSNVLLTRSELSTHFEGLYDGLRSNLLLTRSELSAHFEGLYDGLQSSLLITRSEMSAGFINTYEGLQSHLLMTASALSATFEGLYDGLQSSLLITRSEMSVSFDNIYSGLQSNLIMTASELTSTFIDLYNGVESHVTQTASSWSVSISGVADEYGNVTTASIVTSINTSNESEIHIDADHVYIGGKSSRVVIEGKLDAEAVTASYLAAKIANIPTLNVNNVLAASIEVSLGTGLGTTPVATQAYVHGCPWDLQIVRSGNTYTLQQKRLGYTAEWTDVGSFSRAVTSMNISGPSNGKYTITPSPQGEPTVSIGFNSTDDKQLELQGVATAAPIMSGTADKWVNATVNLVQLNGSGAAPTNFHTATIGVNATNVYTAGRAKGWDNARKEVDCQNAIDNTNAQTKKRINIEYPTEGEGNVGLVAYWLTVDDSKCYLRYNSTSGTVVAELDNTAYENGWNGARGSSYLSVPTSDIGNNGAYSSGSSASYAHVTVKYPKAYANRDSSGNPNPTTVEYTISGGSYTTSGGNTYSCVNLMAGQNVVARARVVYEQSEWSGNNGTVEVKIKGLSWMSIPITKTSSSHTPAVINFDTAGISKSSPGASSYISGRTRAGALLTSGKYYNFQASCGNAVTNYYIET